MSHWTIQYCKFFILDLWDNATDFYNHFARWLHRCRISYARRLQVQLDRAQYTLGFDEVDT